MLGDKSDRIIIRMYAEGATRKEVAAALNISVSAVSQRVGRMHRKLGLHGSADYQKFRNMCRERKVFNRLV